MPQVSLIICVFFERDLLRRLLEKAAGCYDDLVVVHDGPDTADVKSVVDASGGRFFERPRAHQQEPHWPFSWEQARHDWILRLDADEFPSEKMKDWLQNFRNASEPPDTLSGYTCIWPLWNGARAVSKYWPAERNFLFHRQRVRFFGMVEQVPIPDGRYEALPLILEHRPVRKSYGFGNLIFRKQAYRWRARIALSLLDEPAKLETWRWENRPWPVQWERIRRHPFLESCLRLTRGTLAGLRQQWRAEKWIFPTAAMNGPVHHTLIALEYWRLRRLQSKGRLDSAHKWVFSD
jgi:hypothetical protein